MTWLQVFLSIAGAMAGGLSSGGILLWKLSAWLQKTELRPTAVENGAVEQALAQGNGTWRLELARSVPVSKGRTDRLIRR